ncbi:MAG: MMPL family transporter [Actinomyces sp.]|jgi:RND superfamily putative drug exporter|nr:MMPL family transporter [Actinomyces sp.]MCI1662187.1 MMPL family transporter [Actinomyces sp.]
MSSLLHRVGRWCAAHGWQVIAIWTVVLAALGGGVAVAGVQLDDTFELPGTEGSDGLDILQQQLPEAAGVGGQVLFTATDGDIGSHRDEIDDILDQVSDINGVNEATDPFDSSTDTIKDNRYALSQVQADTEVDRDASKVALERIQDSVPEDSGLKVQIGGDLAAGNIGIFLSSTEVVGVFIAIVVLLATFGSMMAAVIPVVTALLGVAVGMCVVLLTAAFTDVSSTAPTLAVMIALAVGIDYALFILSRHRDYLAQGLTPTEAAGRAVGTAGSAVVFAGSTVIVALCAMFVAGIRFLTIMGFVSAAAVAVAVMVALTCVPAVAGLFGMRIRPKARRRRGRRAGSVLVAGSLGAPRGTRTALKPAEPLTTRKVANAWSGFLARFPVPVILVCLAAGLVLSLPARGIELALPDHSYDEAGTETRSTYDTISKIYGTGYNSPIVVLGTLVNSTDPTGTADDLGDVLRDYDGVDDIALATPDPKGTIAVVQIIPSGDDQERADLVKSIRADREELESQAGVTDLMVTGITAVTIDVETQLSATLMPYLLLVVSICFALLMVVFRSVLIPLTAALGYTLSLGSALGVVTWVFVEGHFADLIGVSKIGPFLSFMPIVVMGVLFGLAMDYEVFLVSRMLEEHAEGAPATQAMRRGFGGSSRVVAAAATIMLGVFAAFIPEGNVYVKPIATGLAVGVFVDAFIVRMTLVPSLLVLMGERSWWLPRWLDRNLPVLDVEGRGLVRSLEHEEWTHRRGPAVVRAEGVTLSDVEGTALEGFDLVVRAGQVALVRADSLLTRRALAAALGARLRPSAGRLVVIDQVLPDGTAVAQAQTAVIRAFDDPVPDSARLVVVDDPGARRWQRVRELVAAGMAVVVTAPRSTTAPEDIDIAAVVSVEDSGTATTLYRVDRPGREPGAATEAPPAPGSADAEAATEPAPSASHRGTPAGLSEPAALAAPSQETR